MKVSLVNQIDWEATLQKYKAGLSTGDLPDVVQLPGKRPAPARQVLGDV